MVEREKRRLEDMQQEKFKKEDPKIELTRLISRINFEEIQYKKKQSLKHQRTGGPIIEEPKPLDGELKLKAMPPPSTNQSSRPSSKRMNLHVETGKNLKERSSSIRSKDRESH